MQQLLKSSGGRGNGKRVLVLASDAHGGFGGISQYNRDVIEAMASFPGIAEIRVLPRIIHDPSFEVAPSISYDRWSSRGRLPFIGSALRAAIGSGSIDLVYCAHINLMPAAAAVAGLRRCPMALAIYGIDAWKRPAATFAPTCLRAVDLILSISRVTLDRFLAWSALGRVPAHILPNAVRAEEYGIGARDPELVRRWGLDGRKVIMTLGRMASQERYKGFDEVLDEMPLLLAEHPDLVYLAAGDGPDRGRLMEKAANLGIADRVIFTGRVPEDRKADYYRLADAYVMPSSGEGFGFVVIEALACGIPVVASRLDGTREAVLDGELGLLVDPGDGAGLRRAISEVLAMPKRVPERLSYFSFDSFAARLRIALGQVVEV